MSRSAGSSVANWNWYPPACALAGRTRCPVSRSASAISPSASRMANTGAGMKAGRCSTWPSTRLNSALVTGSGAVRFSVARSVVPHGGAADEHGRRAPGRLHGGNEAARGADAAVADLGFAAYGPSTAGNRLAGKIDDGIRAVEGAGPATDCAVRGPFDLF